MLELRYIKRDIFKEVYERSVGKSNKDVTPDLINAFEYAVKVAEDLKDVDLFNLESLEFIRRVEAFYGKVDVLSNGDNDYKADYIKEHLTIDKLMRDVSDYLLDIKNQIIKFIKYYDEVYCVIEEESSCYLKKYFKKVCNKDN